LTPIRVFPEEAFDIEVHFANEEDIVKIIELRSRIVEIYRSCKADDSIGDFSETLQYGVCASIQADLKGRLLGVGTSVNAHRRKISIFMLQDESVSAANHAIAVGVGVAKTHQPSRNCFWCGADFSKFSNRIKELSDRAVALTDPESMAKAKLDALRQASELKKHIALNAGRGFTADQAFRDKCFENEGLHTEIASLKKANHHIDDLHTKALEDREMVFQRMQKAEKKLAAANKLILEYDSEHERELAKIEAQNERADKLFRWLKCMPKNLVK